LTTTFGLALNAPRLLTNDYRKLIFARGVSLLNVYVGSRLGKCGPLPPLNPTLFGKFGDTN